MVRRGEDATALLQEMAEIFRVLRGFRGSITGFGLNGLAAAGMVIPVNTLPKSASLGSLGLPRGDHWVRFHVEEESISFELEPPFAEMKEPAPARKSTSFVQRWGGTARKIADETDPWLTHINEKHLR